MADDPPDPGTRIERAAALLRAGAHLAGLHRAAAATIGAECSDVQPRRFHHRPGRSVTRVDRAVVSRGDRSHETLLVAHAHRRGEPEQADRVEVAGTSIAVWAFPQDPYLPGLPSAIDPEQVARLLDGVGLQTAGLHLRRRAYRPTRGAVIEARGAGGDAPHAYLKVLRPERIARIAQVHAALGSSLPVPDVLDHADDRLLLGAVPGAPLRRALRRGEPLPDPESLVDLSVRLAVSGADAGESPDHRADPTASAARLLAHVPDAGPRIDAVVAAARHLEGSAVTVHGDLHGGQILVSDARVTGLIDLDGVGRGRMVHDAANLIAYLEVQGNHRPAAAPRARRYADDVAAAYRTLVDPGSLARATAGRWLSLAVVALRAGDEAEVRRRIDRAVEHLGEGA